jgi:predicted nucleic acid-binding protein
VKVLIDTNILLSASLNPSGVPDQAYRKAVTHPNEGCITDQTIDELRRVYNRKFPHKIPALERFLALV